jgi:SNF2 family DNA or RNA helicase
MSGRPNKKAKSTLHSECAMHTTWCFRNPASGNNKVVLHIDLCLPDTTTEAFWNDKHEHLIQQGHTPACFALTPSQLEGKSAVGRSKIMIAVAAVFSHKHAMYGQLLKLWRDDCPYVYKVKNHQPGVSITYQISATADCFNSHTWNFEFWKTAGVYADETFTRLGKQLTPASIIDTFATCKPVKTDYPQDILGMAERDHILVLEALREYLSTKDGAAYTAAACHKQCPFAAPPLMYVERALAAQDNLTVVLKDYQVASLAWAMWREEHGYVNDILSCTSKNIRYSRWFYLQTTIEPAKYVTGGMILEDMGMGKTIEMLGLIMAKENTPPPPLPVALPVENDDNIPYCTVQLAEGLAPIEILPPAGTLVVTPVTLCNQWMSEIADKVALPCEAVLYHGPRRHRDLDALPSKDIVVTTYETLTADLRAYDVKRNELFAKMTWTCASNVYLEPLKTPTSKILEPMDVFYMPVAYESVLMAVVLEVTPESTVKYQYFQNDRPMRYTETFRLKYPVHTLTELLKTSVHSMHHRQGTVYGRVRVCTETHNGSVTTCSSCGVRSYDQLSAVARTVLRNPLECYNWTRIVLDESQKISDPYTRVFHCLFNMDTTKKWCLTGTPIRNNATEMFGQFQFLGIHLPHQIKENMQYYQWLLKDCIVRHTKKHTASLDLPAISYRKVVIDMLPHELERYKRFYMQTASRSQSVGDTVTHANELMQLLYQEREACAIMSKQGAAPAPLAYVLADDAENCSECPVCMENMPGTAAFGCGHTTCYECLRTMLEGGHSGCPICRKTMNPSELASTLQLCRKQINNRRIARSLQLAAADLSPPTFDTPEDSNDTYCTSKLTALLALLAESPLPTIVFTQFGETVTAVLEPLRAAGYVVFKITGDMSAADREKSVKGFHSLPERVVFVMTLRSASCGLNLVHGKRVVFVDVPLNEQLQLQGESRVYRFGQNASVEVSYIYYSNSVEERVWKYRNMDGNPGANGVVAHTAEGTTIIMTESNKRLQRQHQLAGLLITS